MIQFTDDHNDIRDMVASFSDNELRPQAAGIDHGPEFPRDVLGLLSELGILGISVAEEHGGADGDLLSLTLVLEELARGCASTALIVGAHVGQTAMAIAQHGTDEQKARYLPKLASGETLGTFALIETGAETDAGAITCRASKNGDGWVLDGVKKYITAGSEAGLLLVVARTEDAPEGTEGLCLFLVDGGAKAEGVRVVGVEDMLGLRGCVPTEIAFEGCQLGADALLGGKPHNFEAVLQILATGRIAAAAIATGISRSAIDFALGYASERKAFGRTINRFEALRNMFADAAVGMEAGRLLTYRAASLHDSGKSFATEASMAKLHACESAYEATKSGVQILGGNGYSREYPSERMYRDAKTLEVVEASGDLHRRLIARALIGDRP